MMGETKKKSDLHIEKPVHHRQQEQDTDDGKNWKMGDEGKMKVHLGWEDFVSHLFFSPKIQIEQDKTGRTT